MSYADPPLAGRFHLLDVVGTGGMGQVWRAWDLAAHELVAVKVLRHGGADHLLRFVREQALRIDHPHVTAPTAWVADDERVAFAMRLARGGSLADLVAERRGEPFAPAYVAELLDQLLDGLVAVHAAGVVHRDLKPANLLLEATGRGRPHLRIGDFGVAAVLGDPTTPVGTGTSGFAAPEQLAGAATDPRQDLYAVGVTARHLLGRAPGPLDALVADLTEAAPERRPATAAEAHRRLRALRVAPPLRRPRVPDRVGGGGVPVPAARRHVRAGRRPAPVWVLGGSFVASGVGASATTLLVVAVGR